MSRSCRICGKSFSRQFNLQRHAKLVHGKDEQVQTKSIDYKPTLEGSPLDKTSSYSQDTQKRYSIQLRHPFGMLIAGGTKSGKTTFVKQLLSYANIMIDHPPEIIIYFYSEYQGTFGEIETLVPGIQFVQGLPDAFLDSINPQTRNLFIIDDMMGEKDAIIAKLFTKKSHHGNLSVIYIVQNLFHQSKDHRTISLNASYLTLTKNVRDQSQVTHLAKQLHPNNTKFFQQAYQMATKEPYSYLFVDLTPTCPDEIRVRSGIFPTDTHYVYQPRE